MAANAPIQQPLVEPARRAEGTPSSLDPSDWPAFRQMAHAMLDDALQHLSTIREQPVWREPTHEARAHFALPLPHEPEPLPDIRGEFLDFIQPYSVGNLHPRFMGWVHGAGTPAGMLAEMLAGGLNANLGGRDHIPVEVERQVTRWMIELFGFPEDAGGLFVTGASMGNFVAVLTARTRALGADSRSTGVAESGVRLTAYASRAAHNCIPRAMEMAGLGSDALRLIPTDAEGRIDLAAAIAAIAADREAGFTPFLLVGTAGSVDIGAIDDLLALAGLAAREDLWLHVDGALGALGMMSPELAPKLAGIERAHSIAFDFHKWGQAPYDAGFVLVREQARQLATFASPAAYLGREGRGLAGGSPWPCDLGPDLSRGFRALKVWFTLKAYGAEALGEAMAGTCRLARRLAARVDTEPELERLAPAALNIVCFRYRAEPSDDINREIVIRLQESGVAAPSTTVLGGRLAIRAAIVNHRTREEDVDLLLDEVLSLGRRLSRPQI
jgi:glutamate/tyrosine decarboxylase-like PLP-dependent enzyme